MRGLIQYVMRDIIQYDNVMTDLTQYVIRGLIQYRNVMRVLIQSSCVSDIKTKNNRITYHGIIIPHT